MADRAPEPFTDEDDAKAKYANKYFYELNFSNKGGLVMPIHRYEFTYADGTKMIDRIPARNMAAKRKAYAASRILCAGIRRCPQFLVDPYRRRHCDIDESNNYWGKLPEPSKFQGI